MKNTITAIICTLIIWISFYSVQINKQDSIERQKVMEIEQQNKQLEFEKEKTQKANEEKEWNKKLLSACLQDAGDVYWSYVKLNGTENKDWTVTASTKVWDEAQKRKDKAVDVCFKKYK